MVIRTVAVDGFQEFREIGLLPCSKLPLARPLCDVGLKSPSRLNLNVIYFFNFTFFNHELVYSFLLSKSNYVENELKTNKTLSTEIVR